MNTILGYSIRVTDAVYADHIKVERGVIFCGVRARILLYNMAINNQWESLLSWIEEARQKSTSA